MLTSEVLTSEVLTSDVLTSDVLTSADDRGPDGAGGSPSRFDLHRIPWSSAFKVTSTRSLGAVMCTVMCTGVPLRTPVTCTDAIVYHVQENRI